MSTMMLDPLHIAALVDCATAKGITSRAMHHDFGPKAPSPGFRQCRPDDADYLGEMLTDTMRRAVRHVYHDAAERGMTAPVGAEPIYSHASVQAPLAENPLSEIQIGNALRCYEYQASDAPDWNGSEAERFCHQLSRHLLGRLGQHCELWAITPEYLRTRAYRLEPLARQ